MGYHTANRQAGKQASMGEEDTTPTTTAAAPATAPSTNVTATATKGGGDASASGSSHTQKIAHLVLDTGALIKGQGYRLAGMAERFWTIPEVIAEVRDPKSRCVRCCALLCSYGAVVVGAMVVIGRACLHLARPPALPDPPPPPRLFLHRLHSFHLATLPFELHTKEPTPEVRSHVM